MDKPKILCLVGKSGSGKTTAAEYIEKTFGIKMIESWTDRLPRYIGEPGHSWATKDQFDMFKKEDMIAYTKFGDYRYCCLKSDVKDKNIYVIDEIGLKYLKETFTLHYNIKSAFIYRDIELRKKQVTIDRLKRDETMFSLSKNYFDYFIINNTDIETFNYQLNRLVCEVFYGDAAVF